MAKSGLHDTKLRQRPHHDSINDRNHDGVVRDVGQSAQDPQYRREPGESHPPFDHLDDDHLVAKPIVLRSIEIFHSLLPSLLIIHFQHVHCRLLFLIARWRLLTILQT